MNKYNIIPIGNAPVSSFEAYKNYVRLLPNMDEEEEVYLVKKLKEENCMSSAQKLILSQLKNVLYIASKYKGYGLPQEDLVQEGNIGLMKAVKNFELTHKVRLYTYALIWIKSEIQSYILKNWKIVKIATTQNLKKLFFSFKVTQKKLIDLGVSKADLIKNISLKLNVSEEDAREIQSYFSSEDLSLEGTLDESGVTIDIPTYNTPEIEYQEKHDNAFYEVKLKNNLNKLTPNQQKVIQLRFYEEEKSTHKEISEILNVSSERVRQIEQEALLKLKKLMVSD